MIRRDKRGRYVWLAGTCLGIGCDVAVSLIIPFPGVVPGGRGGMWLGCGMSWWYALRND